MIQFFVRVWSAVMLAGLISGQAYLVNGAVVLEALAALSLSVLLAIGLTSGIRKAQTAFLQKMSNRLHTIRGQMLLQFTLKLAMVAVLVAQGHFVVATLSLSNVLLAYAFYAKLQYRLQSQKMR